MCEFLKHQHRTADVGALARVLQVDELQLRQFLEVPSSSTVDPRFLLELLVAVVDDFGVDCSYLLTGAYSYSEHCYVEAEHRSRTDLQSYMWRRLSELSRQTPMRYATSGSDGSVAASSLLEPTTIATPAS